MTYLIQITLPYACYGIEVKNGIVIDTPPVSRWMIGKPFKEILVWIKTKGGKVKNVTNLKDNHEQKG